jgi:hypothetical protein
LEEEQKVMLKKFMRKVDRINDVVAAKSTLMFGTMWMTYLFLIWSLIPLIFPSQEAMVFYVSGGIIQLVALPLIMVGQSVLSRAAERRAQIDHKTLLKEMEEIKFIQKQGAEEIAMLNQLLKDQKRIIALLQRSARR